MGDILWKYGDDVRYAYAVGVVRVLETRLLSKDRVERAADAVSTEDVLRILAETPYSDHLHDLESPEEYESFLEKEHQRVLELVQRLTEDPRLSDLMLDRFDFHNLKVAIKEKLGEQDLASAYVPFGRIAESTIRAAFTEEDYSILPEWLAEAAKKVVREFPDRQDPKWIDFLVDREMYERLVRVSREERNLFLHELIQKEIDIINILSFFRNRYGNQEKGSFQESFIEGGSLSRGFLLNLFDEPIEAVAGRFAHTSFRSLVEIGWDFLHTQGSFSAFERLGQEIILEYVRRANLIAFGIEPLFAYVYAKENELRMIRTIMVGKLNNVPSNQIKESLPRVTI